MLCLPFGTVLTCLAGACLSPVARHDDQLAPLAKATSYLAAEVPRWRPENRCFSCHHNGDALRALVFARSRGHRFPDAAIDETIRWLERPGDWESNGGKGPFSDKRLARIQFAAALSSAIRFQNTTNRAALLEAADALSKDQAADGSWAGDVDHDLGSPATYGRPLATAITRAILRDADPARYADSTRRAERWFVSRDIRTTLDAAATVLALDSESPKSRAALLWLLREQAPDGGWGPYPRTRPEPFDTGLALIALAHVSSDRSRDAVRKGRSALIAAQQPDGSWIETTRPAGSESYAQRVSTTAWATIALLVTEKPRPRPRAAP